MKTGKPVRSMIKRNNSSSQETAGSKWLILPAGAAAAADHT
jgi:hypothetical protein